MRTQNCILWIFLSTFASSIYANAIRDAGENLPLDTPCQVRNRYVGVCILLVSCKPLQNITISDDIMALLSCGNENIFLKVCCPRQQIAATTPAATPATTPVTTRATTPSTTEDSVIHFGDKEITSKFESENSEETIMTLEKQSRPQDNLAIPSRDICGKIFPTRIVGGDATAINEFPWLARLKYRLEDGTEQYACAGNLITHQHVLSVAHCVTTRRVVSVRLGEWDDSTDTDCNDENICSDPPVDRGVSEIRAHPHFDRKGAKNDIAVIRLDAPVNFTDYIRPICLPTSPYAAAQDYNRNTVYESAGWGLTQYGEVSQIKRKISLNAVPYEICQNKYSNTLQESSDPLVICAGGERGVDTCSGDSGGPLIAEVSEDFQKHWYLFGMTSLGVSRCGLEGTPGLYTRITKYMDWIEQNIT